MLLKVADENSAKLDLLIAEPLETGIAMAAAALSDETASDEEEQFRRHQLMSAYTTLNSAYTFAKRSPTCVTDRFRIRLLQALIAREAGASHHTVRTCVAECVQTLERDCISLGEKVIAAETAAMHAYQHAEQVALNWPLLGNATLAKEAGITGEELHERATAEAARRAELAKARADEFRAELEDTRAMISFLTRL